MKGFPHSGRGASPALPQLGLERVSWVRIVLDPAGNRCEVVGVGHRRPVLRRVPLRTATALLAGGVPGIVRSCRAGVAPEADGLPIALGDDG